MFYIAIVFYVMLYGFSPRSWAPRGFDWWSVLLTVLFLSGFHPATITSVVPGGWSIVAEVNFYLILPFLLDRLTTIKSSIYFLLFSLGMYGISRIIFKYLFFGAYSADQHTLISNFVFMNFFGQLPIFGMGIFAYFLFSSPKSLKLPVIFGNLLLISWLMILILLPSSAVTRLLGNYFAIGAAFALFAVTLGTFPVRFLVNRFIIIIGKISFSMYLVHFAVSYFFARFGISAFFGQSDVSSVLHFLCIVAVTVPLSAFFYITVEQQGILLGKRVIDRMEQGAPLGRRKAADEFISS
jgi:peptidoglycan/LPS O-acetylase OafA/YrhL